MNKRKNKKERKKKKEKSKRENHTDTTSRGGEGGIIYPLVTCKWLIFFWFFKTGFLCRPGYPGTHSAKQLASELRNPPASDSQVLGLKGCSTTAQQESNFIFYLIFLSVLPS